MPCAIISLFSPTWDGQGDSINREYYPWQASLRYGGGPFQRTSCIWDQYSNHNTFKDFTNSIRTLCTCQSKHKINSQKGKRGFWNFGMLQAQKQTKLKLMWKCLQIDKLKRYNGFLVDFQMLDAGGFRNNDESHIYKYKGKIKGLGIWSRPQNSFWYLSLHSIGQRFVYAVRAHNYQALGRKLLKVSSHIFFALVDAMVEI